jgi:hypothetical protein|nr:hypothetical protein [Candidatus Krumholzibacteria bacterium]
MAFDTIEHGRRRAGEAVPADTLQAFGEAVGGATVESQPEERAGIFVFEIIDTRDRGWAKWSVVRGVEFSDHQPFGGENYAGLTQQPE